jgi:intracellular multiplication protein IcmE
MQLQSKLTQLEFCNLLKAAGFDAASLKAAGFDAACLKAAGVDAASLKAAGFDAAAFRAAGYDWSSIKAAGFSAVEAKAAGSDPASAQAAGYDKLSLLVAHGYDAVAAAGCDVIFLKAFKGREKDLSSYILVSFMLCTCTHTRAQNNAPPPPPAARWPLLLHDSSLSQS